MDQPYWYARVPITTLADQRLSPSARLVYVALCRHANAIGTCWPGRRAIEATTGIKSRTTIGRAIAELEDAGHITVIRRKGDSNFYTIAEIRRRLNGHEGNAAIPHTGAGS